MDGWGPGAGVGGIVPFSSRGRLIDDDESYSIRHWADAPGKMCFGHHRGVDYCPAGHINIIKISTSLIFMMMMIHTVSVIGQMFHPVMCGST